MLKVAVVILVVMLAYATVYCLLGLIVPEVALKSNLGARGKTVDEVRNDGYLGIIATSQRNIGVFALATIISAFFVLFAGFRKAEKWAWWAFLVVGNVAWVGSLGDVEEQLDHIVFLVGLCEPVCPVDGYLHNVVSFYGIDGDCPLHTLLAADVQRGRVNDQAVEGDVHTDARCTGVEVKA